LELSEIPSTDSIIYNFFQKISKNLDNSNGIPTILQNGWKKLDGQYVLDRMLTMQKARNGMPKELEPLKWRVTTKKATCNHELN
jgi:hypothetical protein